VFKKQNFVIFASGIIIVLFFSFWQIHTFPQDVSGEVIIFTNSLRCLQWAHQNNQAPQECFKKGYSEWENRSLTDKNYEITALVLKWWSFFSSAFFNIFGYSILTIQLLCAAVGLVILFATYKLGKVFYSDEVGLIASIFLVTSAAYHIITRSALGFTTVEAVSIPTFYFLYKYLESERMRDLIIIAILLGIGSFEAPPQFFLSPAVVFLVMLFNVSVKKENIFRRFFVNIRDIGLVLLISIAISILLNSIFALYYKTSLTSVYEPIFFWIGRKVQGEHYTHQYLSKSFFDSIRFAIIFIRNAFLGMSPMDLDDYGSQLEGLPMIRPIILVLFVMGLLFMPAAKKKANRLILTWLGVNFFVFMFIVKVQTRYVVSFLPAICIVSSLGLKALVDKIRLGRISTVLRMAIYLCVIVFVTQSGYKEFFINFKENNANLWRMHNTSKIADFVQKNSSPENCLVVLGERFFHDRNGVLFSLKYRPYQILYLEEVAFDISQQAKNENINLENIKGAITELEKNMGSNTHIFFVFSEHKVDYYFPAMVSDSEYPYVQMFKEAFLKVYPQTEPQAILRYANGDPTHSIYIITPSAKTGH
jgi:hypothetical protein